MLRYFNTVLYLYLYFPTLVTSDEETHIAISAGQESQHINSIATIGLSTPTKFQLDWSIKIYTITKSMVITNIFISLTTCLPWAYLSSMLRLRVTVGQKPLISFVLGEEDSTTKCTDGNSTTLLLLQDGLHTSSIYKR